VKKENDINIPLLSVCLITYNHADYIQQAIEGVLMQKTNFEWEFIIADDFSKDGTREILLEYKKKYPGLITLLLQSQNVGGALNWKNLLESANGKYIAYFDGDDYWIDCNKLQKQVDFMEAHLNYSMCFHTVNVKIEIDNLDYSYPTPYKVNLTFKDILFKHYIPTCSLLFRKESLPSPMPDFLFKCIMGDIPLELMLANQ
jgi:glycosyltransferase involved in cell wall biosynthesis